MITISKNLILTLMTRCITMASGLLISIFTAHYLGPSGRGEYFYVSTISALLVQFGSLGMQASNVYLVAKTNRIIGSLVTNALWVSFGISAVSVISIYILLKYYHHSIVGIGFVAILAPASLFYLLATNLLVGVNKIKHFNLFQICSSLAIGGVLLMCGAMHFSVQGFLAATSLSWLVIAFLLIYVISRDNPLPFKFNFKVFYDGFLFGIKTYIATFFCMLILKGNIFLLKQVSSVSELGYYSISSQINDYLTVLPTMCALLLFPELVRNVQDRWQRTKKTLWMVTILLIVLYIIVAFSAQFIIPIIFGKRFSPSIPILVDVTRIIFFRNYLGNIPVYCITQFP